MTLLQKLLFGAVVFGLAGCSQPVQNQDISEPADSTETELVPISAHHDEIEPEITPFMRIPSILVFSKTNGWRHNEGIAGADHFFVGLARDKGYGIFTTANGAVFNPATLDRFKVIIFNNVTGDALSPEQESAFEDWLQDGGAWIGLHGAGDSSHEDWDWYQNYLIGPTFTSHPMAPQFQDARVVNLAPEHPIMEGIPAEFMHNDEWYSFDSVAQAYGHTPLAGLDESTYSPRNTVYGPEDLRMGEGAINHPIIWSHCPGSGRAFYSAIGHNETSYADPVYKQILINAFDWVSGEKDPDGTACPAE